MSFLEQWGGDWKDVRFKVVLSQTGFCGGAHLHGSQSNRLHADLDSNGWPQTGRNKALRAIQRAGAIHIARRPTPRDGDPARSGPVRDGPWAFVVPAVVNNYYSRWWWPADEKPGDHFDADSPLPWTGDYYDGFGKHITMHAYANPDAQASGAGYGLIRFNVAKNRVTFECWPRDVTLAGAKRFPGWPWAIEVPPRRAP